MKFFLSKAFALLVVFMLVQIPLHWIDDINDERMANKGQATYSVSQSYAGHQVIAGPVLVFPYTITYWREAHNKKDEVIGKEQKFLYGSISFLPEELSFTNNMKVSERKVGIFPVPIFQNQAAMQAEFSWDKNQKMPTLKEGQTLEWRTPYLTIGISDQHGIKGIEKLTWNDAEMVYQPGSQLNLFSGSGIHASLGSDPMQGTASVSASLNLIGTELLRNLPMANQTKTTITSNWPHPKFTGTQLPDSRSINDNGFVAQWNSSALATNIHTLWEKCANLNDCKNLRAEEIGVSLIDPTDFYTKIKRALKYGFLFLAITFISFVLFEVLCDLRIHPIQYTLLGITSGIFFLLLLSFSEHIGFAVSYLIATSACLVLLTFYVQAFMKQWNRSLVFTGILAGLYIALYIILQLEDAALITGSILIFSLLSAAMILTKNIDWYAWQDKLSKNTTE